MNIDKISDLLYMEDTSKLINELKNIKSNEELYLYAYNMSYNDNYTIDKIETIINNDKCDLNTALMMFCMFDGYSFIEDKQNYHNNPEWHSTITNLYNIILSGHLEQSDIQFSSKLTKVQIYKLKKLISSEEEIFIQEFGNKNLDISL